MKSIFILGLLATGLVTLGLHGAGERRFSVASIRGTCIWQSAAYPTTSGSEEFAGPSAKLSAITFDGNGKFTMDYDLNLDGKFSSSNGVPGVYSVDSNGHGHFTYTSPASNKTLTFDFRMSRNGQVMHTMTESYSARTETPRVDSGTCSFED